MHSCMRRGDTVMQHRDTVASALHGNTGVLTAWCGPVFMEKLWTDLDTAKTHAAVDAVWERLQRAIARHYAADTRGRRLNMSGCTSRNGSATTRRVAALAKRVLDSFAQWPTGVVYVLPKAPHWVHALVRAAHDDGSTGGMLPDNVRHEIIQHVCSIIADSSGDLEECRDFIQENPEVYTSNLTRWLNSDNARLAYVDEAVQTYGGGLSTFEALQAGYTEERLEVLQQVWDFLASLHEGEARDEDKAE